MSFRSAWLVYGVVGVVVVLLVVVVMLIVWCNQESACSSTTTSSRCHDDSLLHSSIKVDLALLVLVANDKTMMQ